jgi:pimeloyl-ACP methyl ester carboxylesterase
MPELHSGEHLNRRTLSILAARLILIGAAGLPPATLGAGVDESSFQPIGGIDQWLSIRGADARNPVILVVHGGPGESQWPVADMYRSWETAFTVVQWDQRGAGHTYGRYGAKTPEVTLERIANDGIEVAQYLLRRLHKSKIIVLGHSWGSIVGVRMMQLRPGLFAAYVGTGQVASWKESVEMQFELLREKAQREDDQTSIKQFNDIGKPDPTNAQQYFTFSKGLRAAMAPSDQAWLQSLRDRASTLMAGDRHNFQNVLDGMDFSSKQVLSDQMSTNLRATAGKIDTAFFVIQGREDVVTPTKAAIDYCEHVESPHRYCNEIPDAGHFAFMTTPAAFLSELTDKVRPVAIARGA